MTIHALKEFKQLNRLVPIFFQINAKVWVNLVNNICITSVWESRYFCPPMSTHPCAVQVPPFWHGSLSQAKGTTYTLKSKRFHWVFFTLEYGKWSKDKEVRGYSCINVLLQKCHYTWMWKLNQEQVDRKRCKTSESIAPPTPLHQVNNCKKIYTKNHVYDSFTMPSLI